MIELEPFHEPFNAIVGGAWHGFDDVFGREDKVEAVLVYEVEAVVEGQIFLVVFDGHRVKGDLVERVRVSLDDADVGSSVI